MSKTLAPLLALVLAISCAAKAADTSVSHVIAERVPSQAAKAWPEYVGLKEIYSTFHTDPDNLYQCCVAYAISAPASELGVRYSVAAPFTPAADGFVKRIDVAMYWVSGVTTLNVSLQTDENGLPGAIIKRFVVQVSPYDGCCAFLSLHAKGILVRAGSRYWLAARAPADGFGGWFYNSLNRTGMFARKYESGRWVPDDDLLPAFRVLGN